MQEEETKTNNEESQDNDQHNSITEYCTKDIYIAPKVDTQSATILSSHQEPPIGGGGGNSFFFDIPQDYYKLNLKTGGYEIASLKHKPYTAISKVAILTEKKDGGVTYCVYENTNPNTELRLWLSDKKDAGRTPEPTVVIKKDNDVFSIIAADTLASGAIRNKKNNRERQVYGNNSVVSWELYDPSATIQYSGDGDDMYYIYIMFSYPHIHPADQTS